MFRKPILLGAIALSAFAAPAGATAPLAVTMPGALPLVAVSAAQSDCAIYAQRYSMPVSGMSKSSAILGGKPSALEALKRQQEGAGNSILSPPANSIISPAAPAATTVSYAPALPMSALGAACIGQFGGQMQGTMRVPVLRSTLPPPARSIGAFLGTERVAIGSTRFDKDWNRVAGRGLSRRDLRRAIGAVPQGRDALLSRVNRWVNQAITYRDDIQLDGERDYWADARETLRRGMGDCEDYAILKMQMLAAAGIDRDDMMLTLLRDTTRRVDHAVLLVRDGADWVMLDLQSDNVVPAAADYGYRPVLSFSDSSSWIHGRKRQKPRTVRVAYSN